MYLRLTFVLVLTDKQRLLSCVIHLAGTLVHVSKSVAANEVEADTPKPDFTAQLTVVGPRRGSTQPEYISTATHASQ